MTRKTICRDAGTGARRDAARPATAEAPAAPLADPCVDPFADAPADGPDDPQAPHPAGPETHDAFLGGRLHLLQPARGYRAGVDPVLLAAAVPARAGQSVLDLGCGVGAAALCLGVRVPGLTLFGIERQPLYADLARRNGAAAGQAFEVATGDLRAMPDSLRQRRYDHVIANPPYYLARTPTARSPDAGREAALGEETPLSEWMAVAGRRVAPRGCLSVIIPAARLRDLLAALPGHLGSVSVLPLAAREGREAKLVILRAWQAGRAGLRLHAPLILHPGDRHLRDREDYRPEIRAVLRDASPIPWPD
ncbi:methyltransferase domain-containing protein [Mesobaculum littorinae]|uniref:Methyltransferase domain-containing protein n=1 Tax=Mesobaculum littorinae TaxID=2486419 RepID=A0A438AGV2_9RHOB|nr:methyltransferase [Mesobaculum littorinae]RVV97797.1 methyltransferase domain-containing protein [Mesobaculum littorinae]